MDDYYGMVPALKLVNHGGSDVRYVVSENHLDAGGWLSLGGLAAGYSEYTRNGDAWVQLSMPYGMNKPHTLRVTTHLPNFDAGEWLMAQDEFSALGAARVFFQQKTDEMTRRMAALALLGRIANADT